MLKIRNTLRFKDLFKYFVKNVTDSTKSERLPTKEWWVVFGL